MDTAVHTALRRPDPAAGVTAAAPESARALAVTVSYLLSESGRKASLLAGGNGRELQEITLQIPSSRLHLVTVDAHGVARLKLRPRFDVNSEQRIVRIDALPVYDKPPEVDDLFRAAAKNHELERAYEAERTATKAQRRDSQREQRRVLAQSFLADPTQRALVHPAPSTKRCFLQSKDGRVSFDVDTDEGIARDLPAEAHRRFRSDLRARRERNMQERAAQLALHEDKRRYIAEWIHEHGTAEQRVRQAAGVLPMDEAIEAITDQTLSELSQWSLYPRDGAQRLQAKVTTSNGHSDARISDRDVLVAGTNAVKATATQWAAVQRIQAAVPQATVTLREHKLTWRQDTRVSLTSFGVLVTCKKGPFTLRREYALDEPCAETSARDVDSTT
jgi:hypothetical protein